MTDNRPVLFKYCFKHRETGKRYVVGAYDRDEAIEMVAQITGDFNFEDTDLPPEHS